ncbi:MAG: RluA family pseudouridine synthase [bacterium]
MDKFKIKNEDEGKRLDIFLKENYPDLSRSFLQKKIKEGEIRVNGESSAVHRFLKEGDFVESGIRNQELGIGVEGKHLSFAKATEGKKIKKLASCRLDIIAETDDYLVINKPCGLVVHPVKPPLTPSCDKLRTGSCKGGETLADILLGKYPKITGVGDEPERPGIVHRLDKEVSGVMAIAKTQEMFLHLKKQFQDRTIKKEYVTLVYGDVKQPDGVINFPIGRSKDEGTKMAARPLNQGGRDAITEFTVIKHLAKWTLLSVHIKTGRMHQIRVHLNAYGHPVVGDEIYKPKKLKPTLKFGDRLFLHAWHLGFTDLRGEWKEFEAPLPEEFAQIYAD